MDGMADKERPEIRVERATDAARYLASDRVVWFSSGSIEPHEIELRAASTAFAPCTCRSPTAPAAAASCRSPG